MRRKLTISFHEWIFIFISPPLKSINLEVDSVLMLLLQHQSISSDSSLPDFRSQKCTAGGDTSLPSISIYKLSGSTHIESGGEL